MNEDFVPFELAKKLKEKGFRKPCVATYDKDGMLGYNYYQPKNIKAVSFDDYLCISDDLVLAPTISQVLKWLREEKKIFVEIVITPMGLYKPMIYDIEGFKNPYRDISPLINFNEAAIAGIEYVLDNLI